MSGYHGSKTDKDIKDLWQTPRFVFDYFNHFHNFQTDLAASKTNRLCDSFYSAENSAFNADLGGFVGNVWCNPPYSETARWVDLCLDIANQSDVKVAMLIPADTSVKWFKKAFDNCSECNFISGRLAFINAETQKPVSGNNKGSVVFIFGGNKNNKTRLIERDEMKTLPMKKIKVTYAQVKEALSNGFLSPLNNDKKKDDAMTVPQQEKPVKPQTGAFIAQYKSMSYKKLKDIKLSSNNIGDCIEEMAALGYSLVTSSDDWALVGLDDHRYFISSLGNSV